MKLKLLKNLGTSGLKALTFHDLVLKLQQYPILVNLEKVEPYSMLIFFSFFFLFYRTVLGQENLTDCWYGG